MKLLLGTRATGCTDPLLESAHETATAWWAAIDRPAFVVWGPILEWCPSHAPSQILELADVGGSPGAG
jgi:hypothetical protein